MLVKSGISPLKHLMISLKDRPLTTQRLPHSSLLYADWPGSFSPDMPPWSGTHKKSAYTRINSRCEFANTAESVVLWLNTYWDSWIYILYEGGWRIVRCHLRTRRWYWAQQPLPECSLNALPVLAWTSGWGVFLPQTCCRVFRVNPAALDWRTTLRTGVDPRTRCTDGPQLLK